MAVLDEFPRWSGIAAALHEVIKESEREIEARRDWLIEYMERGPGYIIVAAGAELAAAWLAAAVLGASDDDMAWLTYLEQRGQGRECFRYDFARCLIVHMNASVLADDLSCPSSRLGKMQDGQLLSELLKCLAYETGELCDELWPLGLG